MPFHKRNMACFCKILPICFGNTHVHEFTSDINASNNIRNTLAAKVMKNIFIMFLLNPFFVLFTFLFWFNRRFVPSNDILFRNFSSVLHIHRDFHYVIAHSHFLREIQSNFSFIHVYIIWQSIPNPWILKTEHETILCGKNCFLHEYVKLHYPCQMATISSLSFSPAILSIQKFPPGILPNYVQNWLPPCKKADILLFPTHSDDEFVFLCGVIGKYSSNKSIQIQLAYICEFWTTDSIREHEKLDGLWNAGIRHYPITGPIPDLYPKHKAIRTLKVYKSLFYNQMLKYVVAQIRRFKPSIVVGHDFIGESKHIMHILSSLVLSNAVKVTNDAKVYPDLANLYGLWDRSEEHHV